MTTPTPTLELTPILRDPELEGMRQGDLVKWTELFQDQLLETARTRFETLIQPEDLDAIGLADINPLKPPRGRQFDLIRAGRWCLAHGEVFNLIVEQGGGKTKMSANLAQLEILKAKRKGKHFRVAIICPGHLIPKWIREFTEEFNAAALWAVKEGWFTFPPKLNCLIASRMEKMTPHQRWVPGKLHPNDADVFLYTYEDISRGYYRKPAFTTKTLHSDGRLQYQLCPHKPNQYTGQIEEPPCCPGHPVKGGGTRYCGRHHGPPIQVVTCPRCHTIQTEELKDGSVVMLTPETYGKKWRTCQGTIVHVNGRKEPCNERLWEVNASHLPLPKSQLKHQSAQELVERGRLVSGQGPRKVAMAEYFKRHAQKFYPFDLVIVDEVHMAKAAESARGQATGTLLGKGKVSRITLTATPTGGYASTVFHLGQRTWPTLRQDFAYGEVARFVDIHGTYERTYPGGEGPKQDEMDVGLASRRKAEGAYGKSKKKELPGLSPVAYIYFFRAAGFALLKEIFPDLPEYEEHVWNIELDDTEKYPLDVVIRDPEGNVTLEQKGHLYSHAEAYKLMHDSLAELMLSALQNGNRRYLSIYYQNALRYQNIPTERLTIQDPKTGHVLFDISPFPDHVLFPKEKQTLEAVVNAAREGIQSLIYVHHVHAPDVAGRLYSVLTTRSAELLGRPLKVAVLRADQVDRIDREEYLDNLMNKQKYDVLICSPQLVDTGLDLVWARQIIWYQQITSLTVMSQASRRSFRPGVTGKVDVHFALYQNTTEMLLAELMAKKLRIHAIMSGAGQYAAFTRDLSGAMDLTTLLVERLSARSRDLFVDPDAILAQYKPIIVLKAPDETYDDDLL